MVWRPIVITRDQLIYFHCWPPWIKARIQENKMNQNGSQAQTQPLRKKRRVDKKQDRMFRIMQKTNKRTDRLQEREQLHLADKDGEWYLKVYDREWAKFMSQFAHDPQASESEQKEKFAQYKDAGNNIYASFYWPRRTIPDFFVIWNIGRICNIKLCSQNNSERMISLVQDITPSKRSRHSIESIRKRAFMTLKLRNEEKQRSHMGKTEHFVSKWGVQLGLDLTSWKDLDIQLKETDSQEKNEKDSYI
eukprot:401082_1